MRLPLTKKQKIILTLIRKSWVEKGYSPTRMELSLDFEKISKIKLRRQAIDRHLFALIKKYNLLGVNNFKNILL